MVSIDKSNGPAHGGAHRFGVRLLELWRYPVKSMRGACRAGATLGADKHAAERGEEPEEDECRSHEQEEDEERGTAVSVVGVPVGHFRR